MKIYSTKPNFKRQLTAVTLLIPFVLLGGCFDKKVPTPPNSGNPPVENPGTENPVVLSKLNDTGITSCGDYDNSNNGDNNLDCAAVGATQITSGTDADGDPVPAGQDAVFGRDALAAANNLSKVGYGPAGFDYTKLDENGDDLPESATEWSCVRDNVTGLIWEVKTPSSSGGLHDAANTYTWYSTTNNNGSAGTQNGGSCSGSDCDTQAFTQAVNAEKLCGFSDWRMPSSEELAQLVHHGRYSPAISTELFPNTRSSWYWSSSPYADYSDYAWLVYFVIGYEQYDYKDDSYYVRLVRAGQ